MANPQIDPYLNFDGTCAEAFRFYAQTFGGTVESVMTFRDSPMAKDIPEPYLDRAMHARMRVDGQVIMGSDTGPWAPFKGGSGVWLSLNFATVAAAQTAFDALAVGGTVNMPLQKTFWADAFSMLVDRFGVQWMLGCEKEA